MLLLVLGITAGLVAWMAAVQRAEARALLERRTEAFGIALAGRVQAYVDTLPGLRQFGVVRRAPTDLEFSQYVQAISLQRRFPGLALTFLADRVQAPELASYLQAVRNDASITPTGHPKFAVQPPGERPEYLLIRHVFPFDMRTFGYDLYDPAQSYRIEVDRAIASGNNTATGPILLARDRFTRVQPELTSIVIRMPFYDTGVTPASEERRRQTAQGVVGISFRTRELVRSVLPADLGAGSRVVIHDVQAGQAHQPAVVFDSAWSRRRAPEASPGEPIRLRVDVADRSWEIAVTPAEAPGPLDLDATTWLVLGLGTLLAASAATMARALVDANSQAESRVRQARTQLEGGRESLQRSETRYRLLFETSQEAMLRTRPSGEILAANQAAVRLFGWDERQLMQLTRAGLVDHTDSRLARLLETRATTGHAHGVVRMIREDASRFEAEVTSTVYLDPDGNACTSMIVRDVTHRQHAIERQAMLTAILDSTPDFVGSADSAGRNIFLNRAWRRLRDVGETEDLGSLRIADCHPPWASDIIRQQGMPAARLLGVWSGQTALLNGRGEEVPVSQVIICHRDADRDVTHFSTIARDLTSVRKAESDRLILEAQLRESQKMESIGTLAGGVAHDFNNVLTAILGNASLAIDVLGEGHPAQQNLGRIRLAASRARALVQQILTFSRKTTQQYTVQALGPLVDEAASLLRSTLPPTVALTAVIPDDPLFVLADSAQMQQVVMNLCTNAWQALPGGRGSIEVSLQPIELGDAAVAPPGLQAGRYALLKVTDDGSGMDAATRERVFEPFFTTKAVGEGTGLGLAVVHGIVSSGAGAVTIDSAPGQGSRFSIYLPLQAAPLVEALAESGSPEWATGHGEHILYVDDDEVVALTLQAILERSGYRVSLEANGTDALAALDAHPGGFSLLISDFNMPDLSGLLVAQQVRERHPDLPVIITSGFVTDELNERAHALGVRAVLPKQYSLERLGALVAEVLNGT